MRDYIIQEIRRLSALRDGRAPGQKLFTKSTGISEHQWRGRFWARWGDALAEAGLEPNEWNGKLDSNAILSGLAIASRHFKHFPTNSELEILRRADPRVPLPNVVKRHFGGRAALIAALRKFIADNIDLSDIAALLPEETPARPPRLSQANLTEGYVYLIRSGEFYKIGRSDDAERRFKQIATSLPEKAELFHTIRTDDPPGIEAYWHRRFDDRRANGEWFKLVPHDIAAFKRRKFQ